MNNLEIMDKFLQKHKFPRLNQEGIENMNRPITSTEIETVIKNLPTKKRPGENAFTGKFYKTFREEWRLVQDGGVEGRALTPSCESTRITTNC